MVKQKATMNRKPPPELVAEYEKAIIMVRHFDEMEPGHRTVWHDICDRLELALARYKDETNITMEGNHGTFDQ
jgi:hypothetical protein